MMLKHFRASRLARPQGKLYRLDLLGLSGADARLAITNKAWVITPTLAGGKGIGDFDIQATVGVPVPTAFESTIGTSLVTNVALLRLLCLPKILETILDRGRAVSRPATNPRSISALGAIPSRVERPLDLPDFANFCVNSDPLMPRDTM
jgi:hypothetical protein